MTDLPEHVASNRAYWNDLAADYEADGVEKWAAEEPTRGIFSVPESQLHVLPEDVEGLDSIELGCGTGYVSAWLGRRGARPTGDRQLRSAAGDGAGAAGAVRARVPPPARQRRAGAAR